MRLLREIETDDFEAGHSIDHVQLEDLDDEFENEKDRMIKTLINRLERMMRISATTTSCVLSLKSLYFI